MKKKVMVFMLIFTMCLRSFSSLPAYAANSGGGGVSIDTGESTTENTNLYGRKLSAGESIEVDFTGGLGDYEYDSFEVLSGSVYIIAFLQRDGDGHAVLAYSDSPFSVRVTSGYGGIRDDGTEYKNVIYGPRVNSFDGVYVKKDTASGLYYTSLGSSSCNECISTVPVYWLDDGEDVSDFLSQLADGTFEEENEDDYIGGTEEPDFNQDEAEYVQDLGYLKNINIISGQRSDMTNIEDDALADRSGFERFMFTVVNNLVNTGYDPDLQRRVKFGQFSSTNYDLTKQGTYIRVYSTMTIWNNSMTEKIKSGERRFFKQFDSSSLKFDFFHHEFMMVGEGDFTEVMSNPAFFLSAGTHRYLRSDIYWFQIVHWNGTNWQYGDFTKVTLNKNGTADSVAVTPNDEYIPDSEDKPGTSEGTGDSMDDIEDSSTEVTDSENFTDFVSILNSLVDGIGEFPALVGKVFSFLPTAFIGMLVAGLALIIVLRIAGR